MAKESNTQNELKNYTSKFPAMSRMGQRAYLCYIREAAFYAKFTSIPISMSFSAAHFS